MIHHDQTGFMPDKANFFSIRRLYTIHGFWVQLVRFLHDVMESSIPLTPQCWVLGILEVPDLPTAQLTLLHETLFQALKLIAINWMSDHTSSLMKWIHCINGSLPNKKIIYVCRELLGNFLKYNPYGISPPAH